MTGLTDLELAIREVLFAKACEAGKASVSAKKLYEVVRELPEEKIHIQKKENHWITLSCGRSFFNIAGLDPKDSLLFQPIRSSLFPKCPFLSLSGMIEKTVFAVTNE